MDVRGVNLNLLVALEVLLREGSVTRAAKKAGVSQPAMSHSLAQLRALYGDPLLVRGGHRTPLAQSLLPTLQTGLAELQRVVDARDVFEPATSRRTFRIAASDAFAVTSLHRFVADLADQAPWVDVVLRPADQGRGKALASGSIDICAGSADQPPVTPYCSLELYRESMVCIVRRGHPQVKKRLGLATFCRLTHALVANDEEPAYVDVLLAKEERTRRVGVRLPDYAGLGHVVAHTDMVATVPSRLAEGLCKSLPLRVLSPPIDIPPFSVCLYWHPRFDAEPGHRWLRDRLVAVARTAL